MSKRANYICPFLYAILPFKLPVSALFTAYYYMTTTYHCFGGQVSEYRNNAI